MVHPGLLSDPDTLAALKELGISYVSAESHFQSLVRRLLVWDGPSYGYAWTEFWVTSRNLATDTAYAIIKTRWDSAWRIQVWTLSGSWQPLHSVLVPGEIVPMADALGLRPANPAALSVLLSHPMANRIREDFDLAEPAVEPVGEEDPVPLTDAWPGLAPHLSSDSVTWPLIRCLALVADGARGPECALVGSKVYLVRTDEEDRELAFSGLNWLWG